MVESTYSEFPTFIMVYCNGGRIDIITHSRCDFGISHQGVWQLAH